MALLNIVYALSLLIIVLTLLAAIKNEPPPRLDNYTTSVTFALDLGIITPATFIAGLLISNGQPLGLMLALPLLVLIILLVPQIIISTVLQRAAGVPFTTGEMVGPVAGFAALGVIAAWLTIALLQ